LSLKDLTRRIRRALGLTQEQFAQKLGATSGSVRNWESDRKRPAPNFLKKMSSSPLPFALHIYLILRTSEWRRGGATTTEEALGIDDLPPELQREIEKVATMLALDKRVTFRQALSLGLDRLSHGAKAERQTEVNKKAHRRGNS